MGSKRIIVLAIVLCILGSVSWLLFRPKRVVAPAITVVRHTTPATTNSPSPTLPPAFNKHAYSNDDPTSIWVVVNKSRPLQPVNYAPADLMTPSIGGGQIRAVVAPALEKLAQDASKAGLPLKLISGYRSYTTQQSVYGGYVTNNGQAAADTFSARPGHSEHQTGFAADLGNSNGSCDLDQCFGSTPLGQWLAANAYKYGFVIRYQQDKTPITGYEAEPWHVRYVGIDLALQLHANGQTLEEFFGLPAAPTYP